MKRKRYLTDLTNRQWKHIKHVIPPAKPGGRHRTTDLREVVNAVFYLLVTGTQWRLLPHDFPPPSTVYGYFREWKQTGVWERMPHTLHAKIRQQEGRHKHPTAGCVDSQSVKTTQVPGARGYDKGKQVKGRKRHIVVDTLGLLLVVVVTAASVGDREGARQCFARRGGQLKKLRKVWADGGYDGAPLREWFLTRLCLALTVVLRPQESKGFVLLPRRWVVERTFGWLNLCRRLSKDYERETSTSETWIYIAMTRLMLNRLETA